MGGWLAVNPSLNNTFSWGVKMVTWKCNSLLLECCFAFICTRAIAIAKKKKVAPSVLHDRWMLLDLLVSIWQFPPKKDEELGGI